MNSPSDDDVAAMFQHFVQAFSIPVQLEGENGTIFYAPRYPLTPNPAYLMVSQHLLSPYPVFHTITSDNVISGCVTYAQGRRHLIVGPVLSHKIDANSIIRLVRSLHIPMTQLDEAIRFARYLPEMSVSAFCETLSFVASILLPGNGTIRSSQLELSENLPVINATTYSKPQQFTVINSQSIIANDLIGRAIKEGKPDELLHIIKSIPNTDTPTVTKSSERMFKDTVIAAVSAIAQLSISGGLDTQTAYSLSDYYIEQTEQTNSYEALSQLIVNIMIDYSRRVAMAKMPVAKSETVNAIYADIKAHFREPLSTKDIAARLGLSVGHLCHIFKQETGTTIVATIKTKKIEEVQILLTDTRMSVGDIAAYIAMPPAAFHAAFKQVTGVTPLEYRKNSSR